MVKHSRALANRCLVGRVGGAVYELERLPCPPCNREVSVESYVMQLQ